MQTLFFSSPWIKEIKKGKLTATIRNRNPFTVGEIINLKSARSNVDVEIQEIKLLTSDDITDDLAKKVMLKSSTQLINQLSSYKWKNLNNLYLIEFKVVNE